MPLKTARVQNICARSPQDMHSILPGERPGNTHENEIRFRETAKNYAKSFWRTEGIRTSEVNDSARLSFAVLGLYIRIPASTSSYNSHTASAISAGPS